MGLKGVSTSLICASLLISLFTVESQTASIKDILNINTQPLQRVARDNKYYLSRYGSGSPSEDGTRAIKPEESPEARQGESGTVEKRCSRCNDYDKYDRYDSRSRYYDDRYESRRMKYPDYDYDRYDSGRGTYDKYDRYDRDRYDRDRYDTRDRYDRYDTRDRYDSRDRYYDRYDKERYPERGIGYDNRGYDYRGYERRPYEDSMRGYERERGYGYGSSRPDYYGSGYASSWNYGGRGDDYNKDRGWRDQGYGGYRPRDPYYDNGYRGTSYLYGRPSSTTTIRPSSSQDDNSVTDSPQQTNSPSG